MTAPSQLALHESGHAIVGRYFGFKVGVIRLLARDMISADGTYTIAGYVMQQERVFALDPDCYCAFLLAGKMAVRELDPASIGTADAEIGPREDIRRVRRLLEAIDPDTADRNFKRAEIRAHALVMKYSTLILALAHELDRRRSLDGAALDAFLFAHQEATR